MQVFFGFFWMFFAGAVVLYVVDLFCDAIASMDLWISK